MAGLSAHVEENFEQWVTNRFGKRLYEIFFKTLYREGVGIPCTEIQSRVGGAANSRPLTLWAILNATSLNRRSTAIKSLIHEFRYPRLGPGQMWEMCRDRLVAMGGDVLLRHAMTHIEVRRWARDGRSGGHSGR